jgi:hypothetical protein
MNLEVNFSEVMMKIAVINNSKLTKLIKQTKIGKTEGVMETNLKNINKQNQLIILNYEDFVKQNELFKNTPVIIYVKKEQLRKAITYLRKGVIDIIPEDATKKEINEILINSMEAFNLFKNKDENSELKELKELLSNFVFTFPLEDSLEKSARYIKKKTKAERVFISVVKRGKEKIISGIGNDFDNIVKEYKKIKNSPWIEILKIKKDILINENSDTYKIHPFGFIKIPLFIKDDLIGVITLDNFKKKLNTDFNKELILSAAMLISMHIENYRVYLETIKTKELLKEREQKEILTKLVNSLHHEINNPLTVAYLNLESLKRKMENPNGILKNLDGLEVSLERIKDIMDNVNKVSSGKFLMIMRNRELFNFRYEA